MKKVLLGSTTLLAAGLLASPAFAADGIKLNLGGFFRTAVLVNIDDHGNGDLGDNRYNDGVFSDGEIYFMGKTKLDNGITVGARVELEAEQANDQIDAAYAFFQGGFGEFRIGTLSGALGGFCVTPVGGTTNFGAFTQNQVINNANQGLPNNRAAICRSVDGMIGSDKSEKLVYMTPNFGGFQLAVSWAPNGGHESAEVTDFHSGMPAAVDGEQRNILDAYAMFTRDFDGWGIQWGGGGSWATSMGGNPGDNQKKGAFYQSGLNLTFGNFSIGGGFEYMQNVIQKADYHDDFWVAGGGMAYKIDAYTVGLQYSHNQGDYTDDGVERKTNTMALTGKYAMGPGISLDGTLQYTWADGDNGDAAHGGYDSVGIGLGTAFNF
ncbi:MAG: porin [Rhodospirillaceae bacterium]|nr:MAG: porin [Rhodospirillaceae bacterium]